MDALIEHGFRIALIFLAVFWLWSARHVKRTRQTEAGWLQLLRYWLPLFVAAYLLGPGEWFAGSVLRERFVPHALWVKALGLVLTVAGVLIACWSRQILGRNWSSVVQIKQDHELIEAGPYRVVRHPIYSGLLLVVAGVALKTGDWRGVLAFAIVFVSFWFKYRREEQWLARQFGENYVAYMRRTKALVPGLF